uniref:Uncharacterized protein n=1 Tax=Arundo donax TaxID=35708 RepID=A0A0A9EWA4_ARUDO
MTNSMDILGHSLIIFLFPIQMVTILPQHLSSRSRISLLTLYKIDCNSIKIFLEQHIKLTFHVFLSNAQNLFVAH